MNPTLPAQAWQLRSLVTADGRLELSLAEVPVPEPGAGEVLVRVLATPINPSDIGLLFGAADLATLRPGGTAARPLLGADVPAGALRALAGRVGQSLPVGNEGAGVVVEAGSSPAAQALRGRTVAMIGGAMYAQYRCIDAAACLPLPEGTTAAEGASWFVNPMTALGMVETMRREGQAALLRSLGAQHVVSSASPAFIAELTEALAATGATIAFDAIGGGRLAGQILAAMEAVAGRKATEYSRYGSNVFKQVYIYGGLDTGATELARNFGFAWGVGGWLLFPFLQKIGADGQARLRARVAAELKTTFASRYTRTVSLAEVLHPDCVAAYAKRATGAKFLIDPSR